MVIARFEFLAEHAEDFCEDGQLIVEMPFDDIPEMVEFTKEIEHCLHEVLVFDGMNIISLREVSEKNPQT
jgi:hypothetical protein